MSVNTQIEERIERLEDVAERWDVPGGSKRLAQRARDKAEGLRVARRLLADAPSPDVETVLAIIESHLSTGLGCRCERWRIDTSRRPVDPRAQHRRHVAEVLAAALRGAGLPEPCIAPPGNQGAVDEALRYARTYWQHGNEPETQAALAVLSRAVEAFTARATRPGTPTAVEALQAVLDDVGVGADRFTYVQEWWAVRDRLRAALAQVEAQPSEEKSWWIACPTMRDGHCDEHAHHEWDGENWRFKRETPPAWAQPSEEAP